VGAFAVVWARSFFLLVFLAVWAGFAFTDPLHQTEQIGEGASIGSGLVVGIFAGLAAALVGWLLGNLVGLWVGARWKDECVPVWRQIQVAENKADREKEATLMGAFGAVPAGRPERVTTKLCWHCGTAIEVPASRGARAVRCPGCGASLGAGAPRA
jgi:hypothetical protein